MSLFKCGKAFWSQQVGFVLKDPANGLFALGGQKGIAACSKAVNHAQPRATGRWGGKKNENYSLATWTDMLDMQRISPDISKLLAQFLV